MQTACEQHGRIVWGLCLNYHGISLSLFTGLSPLFAETASFLQAVHAFSLLLPLVGASAYFSSQEMGEGRREKAEGIGSPAGLRKGYGSSL